MATTKKTVKKAVKKSAKKSAKKATVKKSAKKVSVKKRDNGEKTKPDNPLYVKLINLFTRKDGCTLTEVRKLKYRYPTMTALLMAKRHGYKVKTEKNKGGLTRYYAW